MEENQRMIESKRFKEQYRKVKSAFTRTRKLSFSMLIVFILQKSVKSLQIRVNEWYDWLGGKTVSNSGLTQARANLSHKAFIALNARNVELFYEDGDYKRYQGFRLLAVDGSKIRLPKGASIKEEFGAIRVRFVRVLLSTGEYEILVTSLLNEQSYSTEIFKEIYGLRWGVETYYGLIKTRLELENFTGKTVESVLQDLYSTIYLTTLETILTWETKENLETKQTNKNRQQVNHVVSFHAIKTEALNLLLSDLPIEKVISKLRTLFLINSILDKKKPPTKRKNKTARLLLHYHRTQRKHGF